MFDVCSAHGKLEDSSTLGGINRWTCVVERGRIVGLKHLPVADDFVKVVECDDTLHHVEYPMIQRLAAHVY